MGPQTLHWPRYLMGTPCRTLGHQALISSTNPCLLVVKAVYGCSWLCTCTVFNFTSFGSFVTATAFDCDASVKPEV